MQSPSCFKSCQYWLPILVFCFLLVMGCSSEPDPVNKQYLNSDTYKEFYNEIENEVHLRLQNSNDLQIFLQQSYRCDKGKKLTPDKSIPISKFRQPNSINLNDCIMLSGSPVLNFNAYTIGYFVFNKIQLRWLIIENQLLNSRRQLLMAVYNKGELAGYQNLASSQKNLMLDVNSSFKLLLKSEQLVIEVNTTRKVHYPIRQQKNIQVNYSVGQDGAITVVDTANK